MTARNSELIYWWLLTKWEHQINPWQGRTQVFSVLAYLTMSQSNQALVKLLANNLSAVREPFKNYLVDFFCKGVGTGGTAKKRFSQRGGGTGTPHCCHLSLPTRDNNIRNNINRRITVGMTFIHSHLIQSNIWRSCYDCHSLDILRCIICMELNDIL